MQRPASSGNAAHVTPRIADTYSDDDPVHPPLTCCGSGREILEVETRHPVRIIGRGRSPVSYPFHGGRHVGERVWSVGRVIFDGILP
jgi:hypothetical protein